MNIYAVIDTNIIISSLLSRNPNASTKQIIAKIKERVITPMVNEDILEEYLDVLSRSKFSFSQDDIESTMELFSIRSVKYTPECLQHVFIDMNDVIFYETYLMKEDAYLITGNLRHFPAEVRIVSPNDMLQILLLADKASGQILNDAALEYISEEKQAKIQRAMEAMERMHASAIANGIADMSMEEIDEEIRLYREEKRLSLADDVQAVAQGKDYGLDAWV